MIWLARDLVRTLVAARLALPLVSRLTGGALARARPGRGRGERAGRRGTSRYACSGS